VSNNVELKPWPELQEKLPALSSWEEKRLKESIENIGILEPILHLPDGRIIDGHHRLKYSDENPPHKEVNVDEETAFSLGLRLNAERRNLSPEQQKKIWGKIRERAFEWRDEGLTQKEAADKLGISQKTISKWENGSNTTDSNTSIPDLRIRVPKKEKENLD